MTVFGGSDYNSLIIDLNFLSANIHKWAIEKGFWGEGKEVQSGNFGEKIALIHSELSEALEAHRGGGDKPDKHCPEYTNLTIELADAMIRILDLAGFYHLNIGGAIIEKMRFNESREHKHGKAY